MLNINIIIKIIYIFLILCLAFIIFKKIIKYFFNQLSSEHKIKKTHNPLPEWIFSNKCTKSIGCKYHSDNRKIIRNTCYQPNGFTSINLNNTFKNINIQLDNKAAQCLCFLANHDILHKIMKKNSWNVNKLQELYEKDYINEKNKTCYGLNSNQGSESISIRLRSLENNNDLLSYDEIMTTIIHELVHNDINNHGEIFKFKQEELRNMFNSTTMWKVNWTD